MAKIWDERPLSSAAVGAGVSGSRISVIGARLMYTRISGVWRCREMVMVSARERPTTSCSPNGGGKFHLRAGGGSVRSSLLLEKMKYRPGFRWPVSREIGRAHV